jgi:hypothetical protein
MHFSLSIYIVAKRLSEPQPISLTQRTVKEKVNMPLGENRRKINFVYILKIRQEGLKD